MDDGTDGQEFAIEEGVGVEVGGGLVGAIDDLAIQIRDYHVLGAEVVVVDPGGFDDNKALFAIDATGVAEGVKHEAAADEFEVGFQHLGTQVLQQHEIGL